MSRNFTSVLFNAALLFTATVVSLPTALYAETNSPSGREFQPLNLKKGEVVPAKDSNQAVPTVSPSADRTPVPPGSKPPTGTTPVGTTPSSTPLIRDSKTSPSFASPVGKKNEPTPAQSNPKDPLVTPTTTKPGSTNDPAKQPVASPATKPANATNNQPNITDQVALILKLKEKRVYVYQGEKIVANYPVAIGKKGWETPLGEWQVMEKVKNPGWTSFKDGSVLPPGPKNPLGERWIGFWTDGQDVIGFHGTPDVKSIGKAASHGCVRMRNRDVKALYPLVKVGTTVKVVDQ